MGMCPTHAEPEVLNRCAELRLRRPVELIAWMPGPLYVQTSTSFALTWLVGASTLSVIAAASGPA